MSVITDDTIQVPLDLALALLYALSDPIVQSVPGASPFCQDAEFFPGESRHHQDASLTS